MNISLLLEMLAEAAPQQRAIGANSSAVTFADLNARANSAAQWFAGHDAQNVAFVGLNGETPSIALFGAAKAGLTYSPLNYRLPDQDLNRLLERTAPCVAIVDDDMLGRLQAAQGVTLCSRSKFEAVCCKLSSLFSPAHQESEVVVMLFTSGTTGEAKAALLRHGNLTSYVVSTVDFLSSDRTEAALVSVPPYHIAAISAVLTATYSGRRTVYLPDFTAEAWLEIAKRESVTHAMVVPTMLGRILELLEPQENNLPCLQSLSYGGGRMPRSVIERAMRLLPHVDFVNAYGLTETSSTISVLSPEDHRRAFAATDKAERARLESVGRPLPSVEIQIRGPAGEVLGPEQSGEIHVRGDQVSGEYRHGSTRHFDGWFPTRDAGRMDSCGYLYVEGRLDHVIVRGGENISPGDIEDVLREHRDVADVAVLGLPDNDWGERIAAVIVPARFGSTSQALTEWVKSRLRSTRTPEVWEFRECLPYNETGKLLRRKLREELLALHTGTV